MLLSIHVHIGAKLFDTLMVSLEGFFEKVKLEKKSADDNKIIQ